MPFKNPHPLYNIWAGMKDRCLNPNNRQWNSYGGRGIDVCERWRGDFHAFVADMGPRPEGYSLDRIDNDQGYRPENCRWASRKQQQRNQRRAVYVEIDGEKYRAIELADQSGLSANTIVTRAKAGLSYSEVVNPKRRVNTAGLALGAEASKRSKQRRTHCRNGHKFTAENTYITKEGWRACRSCHNAREERRRLKKRNSGTHVDT